MSDQRDLVTVLHFAASEALREIGKQSLGAGLNGGGRNIVEVVEYGIAPVREDRGDAGVVFELPERVESREPGDQHDVAAPGGHGPPYSVYRPASMTRRAISRPTAMVLAGSYLARRRRIANWVRSMSPSATAVMTLRVASSMVCIALAA